MSAYMVSDTHIDAMLTAGLGVPEFYRPRWESAADGGDSPDYYRRLDHLNADQVGAMLLAENRASVNHRYDEDDLETLYTFRALRGTPDPVVVLKAVQCYEYQSCEHPGWETSEAKRFCASLRTTMIGQLAGYDDAPWSVNDRDVFATAAYKQRMS